ncbi:MAG: hypothetical protein IKE52_07400 [Mogibacterium sp.]|nr:hypothetical protein [Mogibacterium sp.]
MKIKVSTERLVLATEEATKYINAVDKHFGKVETIVSSSSQFWEGAGQEAYYGSYSRKKERIESALNSFRGNIRALQIIAGIYEESEQEIYESTQALRSDVIV